MFSSKVLKISNTLRCLAECWLEAEESLRRDINNLYPLADEEFITKMFHGKYKEILREVSEQGLIKDRFLSDLRVAFPGLGNELYRIADGLIAEVSLHRRTTERITGGDLGFVIIRPNVVREYDYLKIKDHRTGLLCQAKLKNRKGKWGQLSANQIKVLQDRLPYLALLLYSYNDQERRYLNPFKWKICNTAKDVKEVQNWLKKDEFSGLLLSDEVIFQLGSGYIGTSNKETISKYISPAQNNLLVIKITWPDGKPPFSEIYIETNQNTVQERQIKLHFR